MDENQLPEDDAINYFKTNILNEKTNSFNSIFLGCPSSSRFSFWVFFGVFLGLYFIFSIYFSNILLLPMTVEGSSMYPTLNAEYTTTNNKYATDVVYLWKTNNVETKDIIVFDAAPYINATTTTYYIKRVIAVGGDTLQFKRVQSSSDTSMLHYEIYINGNKYNEDYINETIKYRNESLIPECVLSEEIISIPENKVFVMGDNRNNSRDSREIGLISTEHITGKVVIHIPYGKTIIHGLVTSFKENYIF